MIYQTPDKDQIVRLKSRLMDKAYKWVVANHLG